MERVSFGFTSPNLLALFCDVLIIILQYILISPNRLTRTASWSLSALVIIILLSTQSRGGFLSVIISLIIMSLKTPKLRHSIFIQLILLSIMTIIFQPFGYRLFSALKNGDNSTNDRIELTWRSMVMIYDHPFGIKMNFGDEYAAYYSSSDRIINYETPLNTALALWVIHGPILFLLYVFIFVLAICFQISIKNQLILCISNICILLSIGGVFSYIFDSTILSIIYLLSILFIISVTMHLKMALNISISILISCLCASIVMIIGYIMSDQARTVFPITDNVSQTILVHPARILGNIKKNKVIIIESGLDGTFLSGLYISRILAENGFEVKTIYITNHLNKKLESEIFSGSTTVIGLLGTEKYCTIMASKNFKEIIVCEWGNMAIEKLYSLSDGHIDFVCRQGLIFPGDLLNKDHSRLTEHYLAQNSDVVNLYKETAKIVLSRK
jgi:hypothetical protein